MAYTGMLIREREDRMKCYCCGDPDAVYWAECADGNTHRVCTNCDNGICEDCPQ